MHTKITTDCFFRVSSVLSHLDEMKDTAAQHKDHIIRLQEKITETKQVRISVKRDYKTFIIREITKIII